MRRDMDLIRAILLELEKHEFSLHTINVEVDGYTAREISYHLHIMSERNLIALADTNCFGEGPDFSEVEVRHITWDGQEFLDSIRDKGFYDKVKRYASSNSVPLTVESVKMIVPQLIKQILDGSL